MDYTQTQYLNYILGAGAILLQVASVVAVLILFFGPKRNFILEFVNRHFLWLGFLIAFSASFFSLVYSEIVGYVPCSLCWYARIFMYPMTLLFGTALYFNDRSVARYAWPLLVGGMLVALYHNFNYYFADTSNLPCDASGISCYQQLVSIYGGYMSAPMMSLSSLIGILAILLVVHFYKKGEN
ncbi:MAG: disulfide bond formation protein B [Candidatus Paceibacterota bacterium]